MVQDVHVHQLDEFASRDCGKERVKVVIRDSMGPAANEEATKRCINTVKIDRIGFRFLALRLPTPGEPRQSEFIGWVAFKSIEGTDFRPCHTSHFLDEANLTPRTGPESLL